MRCIVEYQYPTKTNDALVKLIIHGAPHRRMHLKMIQQYRDELRKAFHAAGIGTPIDYPIDLHITFINPTSPDKDNLFMALCQAMDGATLKKPGILTDDKLIGVIRHMATMYI